MKTQITRLLLIMLWVGAMFTTSCSDDDDMTEVMIDDVVLNFTRDAQDQQLDLINLGDVSNYWHIYSPTADKWLFYERIPGRKSIYIGLDANTTSSVRTSYLMVRSKNHTQKIVINQDNGSTDLSLSLNYLSILKDGETQTVTIQGYDYLENINVTVDAESQSWLTATRENDEIIITAAPNTDTNKRVGKITVSAVRTISQSTIEAVIEVNQGAAGTPPYHIAIPTEWSKTWVYTAEANGKPVAQIAKEFLCLEGTIKAQAIVVYPINDNGDVLISQGGYIAEILLQSDDNSVDPKRSYAYTAPEGNVHGGIVKFLISAYESDLATNSSGNASAASSSTEIPTLNNTVHFTYTPGQAAAAKEIWMLDDQFMTEFDGYVVETTTKPYIVEDNRGADDNFSYGIVKVGCQYWLNSNLKASHWNKNKNYEAIPLVSEGWKAGVKSSFITVYNEFNNFSVLDATNRDFYGVLYSYLAIGGFSAPDASEVANADDNISDNLSPEGWIVPTLPECITMGAYTGGMLACGRLDLAIPHAPENNIVGFNGRKAHYFYNSKFAIGGSFDAQYLTRTYAGSNACYWIANTSNMTMCKNRGGIDRLNLIRCINNGAIKTR